MLVAGSAALPIGYRAVIIIGDVREKLRELAPKSIQTCVTSPPYWGLRDYGVPGQLGLEPTPEQYTSNLVEVFRLVRELLADDGTCWINLGDSYNAYNANRGASKSLSGTVDKSRPTFVSGSARSPRRRREDDSGNLLLSGRRETGQASSRICQLESGLVAPRLKPKDLVGIPWRVAFALQADGWYLRQDIIWSKPNPMPESVRDRCTKSHEYLFLLSKRDKYYFDSKANQIPASSSFAKDPRHVTGSNEHNDKKGYEAAGAQNPKGPHRVFGKSGNTKRKSALERDCPRDGVAGSVPWEGMTANRRSVWTVTTKPFKGAHFATFPPDLIEPCILVGSRPGDTVLDPFGGSGTTGMVADRHGRKYMLIELNSAYAMIAEKRITDDREKRWAALL